VSLRPRAALTLQKIAQAVKGLRITLHKCVKTACIVSSQTRTPLITSLQGSSSSNKVALGLILNTKVIDIYIRYKDIT